MILSVQFVVKIRFFNVFFQCEFASLRVTDSASNADENGPFSDPQVIERAELVLPSQRADTYPAR